MAFQGPPGYIAPPTNRYPFKEGAGGNSIWLHMERLADFASRAKVIVELGTGTCCGSTHAFDLGLKVSNAPDSAKGHFAVDIYDELNGEFAPKAPYFHYTKGDSRAPETMQAVLDSMQEHFGVTSDAYLPEVDILYIDTIHEYEFLKAEMALWQYVVTKNTLCLFHDTYLGGSYNPMTEAIKEMVAEKNDFGAPRRLFSSHRYMEISTHCNGLSALRPIGPPAAGKGMVQTV